MTFALYMDHHVPKAITVGLRFRDVDVITAHEDGADQLDDIALLKRAHELGRALFTQDDYELRDEYDLSKMTVLPRGRFDPKRRVGSMWWFLNQRSQKLFQTMKQSMKLCD